MENEEYEGFSTDLKSIAKFNLVVNSLLMGMKTTFNGRSFKLYKGVYNTFCMTDLETGYPWEMTFAKLYTESQKMSESEKMQLVFQDVQMKTNKSRR